MRSSHEADPPGSPGGRRWRIAPSLVLWCASFAAAAQTPASAPDLRVFQRGVVFAVVALSDGSHIVGGQFSEIRDPATGETFQRANLAKFEPDGRLDLAWDAPVSGQVRALAVGPGDQVYVGGAFDSIADEPRNHLAKLDGLGSGAPDPVWRPFVNQPVLSLAYDPDSDALFVGGDFITIGGLLRNRIAKISAGGNGAGIGEWNQSVNDTVWTLMVSGGQLYAGGDFTFAGPTPRNFLARFSTSGAGFLDTAWNPSPNAEVYALAPAPGGVFAGGRFSAIGGQTRGHLARLSASGAGAADPAWNLSTNSTVFALRVADPAFLHVAGAFTSIAGSPRAYAAKVYTTGFLDNLWRPELDDFVFALGALPSDEILVGGMFSTARSTVSPGLARFPGFSTSDPPIAYFVEDPMRIGRVVRAADGGVYVAGRFSGVAEGATGWSRRNLFRIRRDGTVDPAWNPGTDFEVYDAALAASGTLVLGGAFSLVGGQAFGRIARVSATGAGTPDAAWRPEANGVVRAVAIGSDGSVLASGEFSAIGGQSRSRIAKLSPLGAGAAVPGWQPDLSGYVYEMAIEGDNAFLAGQFSAVNGVPRAGLAKLSFATGQVDAQWDPSPDFAVLALAPDGQGRLYVGGYFGSIGGQSRQRLARLPMSGTGAADPAWAPTMDGGWVESLVHAPGFAYIAGPFYGVGGQVRIGLARVRTTDNGSVDAGWDPWIDGQVDALAAVPGVGLYAGGAFRAIGGVPRTSLALLADDALLVDGFE